ncbi:hypothetical protein JW777_09985 [bacterium]|nr:hypothetical protein [bacterium]
MNRRKHSAFYRDIRIVQAGVILLTLVLLGFTAHLQVFSRETCLDRLFVDAVTLERVDRLVRSGAIRLDAQDRIFLDEAVLSGIFYSHYTKNRIRSLIPHMEVEQGRPVLPESSVSVHYPGNLKRQVRRGAILDRNLDVLAEGPERKRRYPMGAAGYPVTGAIHPVYRSSGMERVLDLLLAGRQPVGIGAHIRQLIWGAGTPPPDVILTINSAVQQALYNAMNGYTGAGVVLDVRTGNILAAVSVPAFDPSDASRVNWQRIHDPDLSLNRCWNRRYPPGSTFKIVNAAALMESKAVDGGFHYDCKGRHFETKVDEHLGHAHGDVNVESAIRVSCNVFFCEAAIRLKSELKTMANRFGFNRDLPLLPSELAGRLPEPDRLSSRIYELDELVTARNPDTGRIFLRTRYTAYTSRDYERNLGTTGRTGFGQGTVEATPLQMALVASVIANRGIRIDPNLVEGVRFEGGQVVRFEPRPGERIVSRETADRIAKAMESVMIRGTGGGMPRLYRHPVEGLQLRQWVPWKDCIPVAGKTGTAEVTGKTDHSWFIGFAPVDEPQYAVAVICENSGQGSHHAGPVAMKVLETLFKNRQNN